MRAGKLSQRVAFDAPVETPDGSGGTDAGFALPEDAYECAAEFIYLRGGETVIASRLTGTQPVIVKIRATVAARAITPDWRLRHLPAGTVFNIRTVVPTPDRAALELICESGVAA